MVTVDFIISVIVLGPDSSHQLSQSSFVFPGNLCEGNSGAGLPVHQTPQPGLSLDNAIENLPSSPWRQEDNQLNEINLLCNYYQLSFLLFHQGGNSINPSL